MAQNATWGSGVLLQIPKKKQKLNEKSVPKSTVSRGRREGSDPKVENTASCLDVPPLHRGWTIRQSGRRSPAGF